MVTGDEALELCLGGDSDNDEEVEARLQVVFDDKRGVIDNKREASLTGSRGQAGSALSDKGMKDSAQPISCDVVGEDVLA